MKLRHPLLISMAARGVALFVRSLLATRRYTYHPIGTRIVPTEPGLSDRFIYTFWHENLLLPASLYGGFGVRVLVSKHADGQLIARAAERLGYHIVHGSTTRGGLPALRELLALGGAHHIVFTPDGPRGPRREFQPGAIYLASRSGLPIVAVGVGYDRPWRAKSWDRFAIPKPFRRAVLVTDAPITVPCDADRGTLERHRLLVQERMDFVNQLAEDLAAGRQTGCGLAAPSQAA